MPWILLRKISCSILCVAALTGCDTGYRKINGQPALVTWDAGNGRTVHVLNGADPATFEVLVPKRFAKDKKLVFYQRSPIVGADAGSFTVLKDKLNYYSKDKHRVYMTEYLIPDADPASFQLLEFPYARDARNVYCGNEKVPAGNIAAFKVLLGPNYHLSTSYYDDNQVKLAIPRISGDGWAKCGRDVFFGAAMLEGIDSDTFQPLNESYAKDDRNVYYQSRKIVGADSPSFVVLNRITAQDKHRQYLCGEPR